MNQMEFQRKFGTEHQCREHLFRKRWPKGFACPRCGHGEYFDMGAECREKTGPLCAALDGLASRLEAIAYKLGTEE